MGVVAGPGVGVVAGTVATGAGAVEGGAVEGGGVDGAGVEDTGAGTVAGVDAWVLPVVTGGVWVTGAGVRAGGGAVLPVEATLAVGEFKRRRWPG